MADIITERQQFESSVLNLLSNITVGGGSGEIPAARLTIIDLVKAKLDEIIPGVLLVLEEDEGLADPYNLLINSFLDESAKRVLQTAPIHILIPANSTTAGTPLTDATTGDLVVPADFLRPVSLKMTEWKREVREFITPADKRYRLQQSIYTRGGMAKPVAVMTIKYVSGESKRVIEYYSVNSAHTVEYFFYVPETDAEDLQSNLTDALTWTCAGMILQVTGQTELAKFAFEQVNACYLNL